MVDGVLVDKSQHLQEPSVVLDGLTHETALIEGAVSSILTVEIMGIRAVDAL